MKIKRNGVALVIVIVLILLFSAIILSVVLTSTTAYRRSTYFRDRSIALNLAHIGIADALYKLNYRYHDPDHYYGFRPDGECWTDTGNLPQNGSTYSYTIKALDLGLPLASVNDGVTIQLKINDGISNDSIIATGKYRGRTITISAGIRTLSDQNTNLKLPLADNTQLDTKGIPEAFNKHTIYANSVSGTGSTVKGNIATTSTKPSPWPAGWTDATWTNTSISLPFPSLPVLPFEARPPDPAPAGWIEFQMRGQPRYRIDGGSWQAPLPAGVVYTSDGTGTETFTFTTYTPPGNRKVYVRASSLPPGRTGGACFDNASIVNSVLADGSITFKGTISLSQNAIFEADVDGNGTGTFVIHPGTTFSGSDLIVYKYLPPGSFAINQSNITINGALVTNCSLTIGTGATNFTVDATGSNKNAAITIYTGSTATFTLSSTPNITLGDNQNYAFLIATTTNPLTVNIGTAGNVNFETNSITNLNGKATVVAYSTNSSSTVNIGSASNYAKMKGLIYSYGTTTGNINVNNGSTNITGCLVANGTVTLNGGTITYDKSAFTSDRVNIYSGFTGGRRIYLPFNWKLVW
ncbi:MAG: hypothetical protein ACPL3Q_01810 [Candidatus Ratteibacteria bacterium]